MPKPTRLNTFKLDRHGLARVFGELEAAVMDAVWELREPTVAEVCNRLGVDANYKTVMTVMNRLVEKRVLQRRRVSRAYTYVTMETREAFQERVSRKVLEGLLADYGDLAIAQFIDAVDAVDPELMTRLEHLVRARTQAGEDGAVDAD